MLPVPEELVNVSALYVPEEIDGVVGVVGAVFRMSLNELRAESFVSVPSETLTCTLMSPVLLQVEFAEHPVYEVDAPKAWRIAPVVETVNW